MVGRPRRRRGLGARRARHEGPGRGERRRVRLARARRLRAVRRPRSSRRGGRGGRRRRRLRARLALSRSIPDAARCDYAINEGGGERLVLGGRPVYLCATAEKMSAPFTVRVHGRSGHASMPGIADNALVKAARYLEALGALRAAAGADPGGEGAFSRRCSARRRRSTRRSSAPRALHPMLAALVEPLLSFTLSPTMIDASHQRNVIPALCEITVDCRLLPETTPADVEPLIRAALGNGRYDLEFLEAVGGTRSPLDTPLWDALERFTERDRAGRAARADRVPGLHRQPLPARGVRDGRVRVLPDATHGYRSSPRSSSTRRTSGSRSTTSSSASTCCAPSPTRCSAS